MVLDRTNVVAARLQEKSTIPVQFAIKEKALLNLIAESNLSGNTLNDLCVLSELSGDHAILGLDLLILQVFTLNQRQCRGILRKLYDFLDGHWFEFHPRLHSLEGLVGVVDLWCRTKHSLDRLYLSIVEN